MQSSGMEQSLEVKDKVASPADLEERSVLVEKLFWTRLELQKTLAVSADADETICKLDTAARRATQERDEARNQRNTLLAQLHARNAQMMMPTGRSSRSRLARPDHAFAATSYHRARVLPTASTPCGWMAQEQYYAQAGASYFFASSSRAGDHGGHRNYVASSMNTINPLDPAALHDLASPSQDSFDPDMFLVDAAESPQDFAPATASPGPGKNSGELELVAEQMLLPRKGKVAQAVRDDECPLIRPATATWHNRADVVNTAGSSHTTTS